MGSAQILFVDPTSLEGIAGVGDYLCSVFGPSANIQVIYLEPRIWGQVSVTDMLAIVTIAQKQVMLRVLYRIVRAEPLEIGVWFDDAKNHGSEIVVNQVVAPIEDHKPPSQLPFSRR